MSDKRKKKITNLFESTEEKQEKVIELPGMKIKGYDTPPNIQTINGTAVTYQDNRQTITSDFILTNDEINLLKVIRQADPGGQGNLVNQIANAITNPQCR